MTPVSMEFTMSRCGVTTLRMSTSWRLSANIVDSWSSTQFLSSRCPGTDLWCQIPVAARR